MIISRFELHTFKLPFKNSITIKKQKIRFLEGLLLKIEDDNQNCGIGEISPLPGLHDENLEDAVFQTKNVLSKIKDKILPNNLLDFTNFLDSRFKLFPSVQFGLESAFVSLASAQKGKSIFEYFNPNHKKSILVNALLTGNRNEILTKLDQNLKNGFTVFKLKVGRNSVSEDIELVNTVTRKLKANHKLRLDANQSWSFQDAEEFLQSIDHSHIEYTEEPLQDFSQLPELFLKTNIPIALDENVTKFKLESFPAPNWLKAVIIKPAVIGGLTKSINLINYAEKNNILAVISDTFHCCVGLAMHCALAALIKTETAMGLDTYSWLADDILRKPILLRYKINLSVIYDIQKLIDFSRLTKI